MLIEFTLQVDTPEETRTAIVAEIKRRAEVLRRRARGTAKIRQIDTLSARADELEVLSEFLSDLTITLKPKEG